MKQLFLVLFFMRKASKIPMETFSEEIRLNVITLLIQENEKPY